MNRPVDYRKVYIRNVFNFICILQCKLSLAASFPIQHRLGTLTEYSVFNMSFNADYNRHSHAFYVQSLRLLSQVATLLTAKTNIQKYVMHTKYTYSYVFFSNRDGLRSLRGTSCFFNYKVKFCLHRVTTKKNHRIFCLVCNI